MLNSLMLLIVLKLIIGTNKLDKKFIKFLARKKQVLKLNLSIKNLYIWYRYYYY